MLNLRLWPVLAVTALCLPAGAADLTDVADAADTVIVGETEREDIFDLYVGTTFRMNLANGKITREPIVRPNVTTSGCVDAANSRDCLPVDEMRWKRNTSVFDIALEIGMFHDLAATLAFHYVIGDTMALRYAKGVTPEESSVDPPGSINDLFPLGATYDSGFRSKHTGWGNIDEFGYRTGGMDLGVRWAPLSDERDDSKPMWVLIFNWSNPWLADAHNPGTTRASEDNPGSVGDGSHYITFGTALSKRVANFGLIGIDPNVNRRGFIEPYMEFNYTFPVPAKGRALPEFTRSRDNFGRRPPHKAELNGGMEVVAVEDLRNSRKVAVDIGLRSAFISEGRSYNELTDALGEVTYTEQYYNVTGLLALYIQAAEFMRFKAGLTFGYTAEHFLTFEEVGEDGANGVADGQVLPNDPADKINPYFCGNNTAADSGSGGFAGQDRCSETGLPSYDQVGFRFKDEEHVIFTWFATLQFTF